MTYHERRFDPSKHADLTRNERQARWKPSDLLPSLGVRSGQKVLDLGCGPGFWTLPLAEIVSEKGTVWALDVSQEMLDALAARKPPAQVQLLLSELPEIRLPDNSVDWVWGAFVAHEVEPPDKLVAEIRRVLRADGGLAILDWHPDGPEQDGPPRHHRLAPQTLLDLLANAGFNHLPKDWQDADSYLITCVLVEK